MSEPSTPPPTERFRKPIGTAWKAVLLGVLADVGATALGSMVLFIALGSLMVSQGLSPDEVDEKLVKSDLTLLLSLVLGLGCTVLGGYVAARTANQREYYHALLTGIAVVVLGEIAISVRPDDTTLAMRIIYAILAIPAALLGAHLRKSARLKRQTEAS